MDSPSPLVSVVMQVYRETPYLEEAIESIIQQTYQNLELIVICDEPTPNTKNQLGKYEKNDPRIRVVIQDKRLGLRPSRNKGVAISQGRYINQMDSDDISYPERLAKQINFMELHPDCSLVATHIELMGESGNHIGYWKADLKTKTPDQIKKFLPKRNCIAHSSVLIRKSIIAEYQYQNLYEDYDMWLRLMSDNYRFCKLPEILLKYRLHPESGMKQTSYFTVIKCKINYLKGKFSKGKMNRFDFSILCYIPIDFLILPLYYIYIKVKPIQDISNKIISII